MSKLFKHKAFIIVVIFLSSATSTISQIAEFHFLYDTICVEDIVPLKNLSTDATKYNWKFETAKYSDSIQSFLHDDISPYDFKRNISIIKADSLYYGFAICTEEISNYHFLVRYSFGNNPINTPNRDTIFDLPDLTQYNAFSQEIIKDEYGDFYIFIILTTNRIVRLSFGNDIRSFPEIDYLNFNEFLSKPKSFKFINKNGNWYCIIGNHDGYLFYNDYKNIVLTTLKFNNGLGGQESSIDAKKYTYQDLGLEYSLRIKSVEIAEEDEKYFVFATAYHHETFLGVPDNVHLLRIEFNTDFTNVHTFDIHDFDIYFDYTNSFSLFKDCGKYFGIINGEKISNDTLSLLFSFDHGLTEQVSIKDTINNQCNSNQYYRFEDKLFFYTTDNEKLYVKTITPIWNNVGGSPDPASFEPIYYYTKPGTYYTVLTVNDDFNSSYCQIIDVIEKPALPNILPDDVCRGDTLFLTDYIYSNINYLWHYNNDTFCLDKYPIINNAGEYSVELYYDGCKSDIDTKDISVLDAPQPTILPDTSLGCPWHDLYISSQVSGGTIPYLDTLWYGEASMFLDNILSPNPIFNGHLGQNEKIIYLSDIDWVSITPSVKKVSRDITIEGLPISLINQDFNKGISTSSNAGITYKIPEGYTNFKASIGIDGSIINCGSVIFNIYADSNLIYSSGIMQFQQSKDIDIGISGSQFLKLELTDAGDGEFCDISNWANARFIMPPPINKYEIGVSITDNFGCQGFDTALVLLDTNVINIISQPADISLCPEDTALINFEVFYPLVASNAIYELQKDSVNKWVSVEQKNANPGHNLLTFQIENIMPVDTGNYRIILASDPCGIDITNLFTIKYHPSPEIIFAPNGYVCNPDSVVLSIQTSFGYIEWYDTIVDGEILDTGNIYITPYLTSNKEYFYRPFDSICMLQQRFPINALVYYSPGIDSINAIWTTHCDSTNGEIEIFSSGGSLPLLFSIDSGYTYQTSNIFDNLSMSYYFTFVSYGDSNCTKSLDSTILVSNVVAPQISNITKIDISDCGLSDGSISHTGINGIQPYEFRVNNGSWINNSTISDLSADSYYSWIRNADSTCEIMHPYPTIIEAPGWPILNSIPFKIDNTDCDKNEGVIIFDASGELPIMYSLDSLSWQFDGYFDSLVSGNYKLLMKYIPNLCIIQVPDIIEITEPAGPEIDTIIKGNISSCFDIDSYIKINATGGQGIYIYSIDSGDTWSYNNTYQGLEKGNYTVAIANSSGTCKVFDSIFTQIIEVCRDEVYDTICKNGDLYYISELLPPNMADYGQWIDDNATGSLEGDVINTIQIPEGVNKFHYIIDSSIIQATITACKEKASGLPIFQEYCSDTVNLFNTLIQGTYDRNGVWYNLTYNEQETDSVITGLTGTLYFKYYVEPEPWSACPAVESMVSFYIDSIAPDISCIEYNGLSEVIPAGQEQYKISSAIAPIVTEKECEKFFLYNNYNSSSTLLNENISSGLHEIIWYATDYSGNTSQCTMYLEILEFKIPSLITPNGDGYNDNWIIDVQENYPNAEIYVYDRWGNLVIASKNGYLNWDGKANNRLVPVDAYQYTIINNNKSILNGSVTIWY